MTTFAPESARALVALWTGHLLPGQRYVSIRRPGLVLADDDISECEPCQGSGTLGGSYEWRGSRQDWGPEDCLAKDGGCDGYGLLHGFDDNGHGLPVEIVEEAPAARID